MALRMHESAGKYWSTILKRIFIVFAITLVVLALVVVGLMVWVSLSLKHDEPAYVVDSYAEAKTALAEDSPYCRFFDLSMYDPSYICVEQTRGVFGGKAIGYKVTVEPLSLDDKRHGYVGSIFLSCQVAQSLGLPDPYDDTYEELDTVEYNGVDVHRYSVISDGVKYGNLSKGSPCGFRLVFYLGGCTYSVELNSSSSLDENSEAREASLNEISSLVESVIYQ